MSDRVVEISFNRVEEILKQFPESKDAMRALVPELFSVLAPGDQRIQVGNSFIERRSVGSCAGRGFYLPQVINDKMVVWEVITDDLDAQVLIATEMEE